MKHIREHKNREPRQLNPGALLGLVFFGIIIIGRACGYIVNVINTNYLGK